MLTLSWITTQDIKIGLEIIVYHQNQQLKIHFIEKRIEKVLSFSILHTL